MAIKELPGHTWHAYGTLWDTWHAYGTIWNTVGHCGTLWDTMGQYGTLWDTEHNTDCSCLCSLDDSSQVTKPCL